MKKLILAIAIAALALLATGAKGSLAQATDPVAIARAFQEALSAGEVETGLSLVADNVKLIFTGPPSEELEGKQAVNDFLEGTKGDHFVVTLGEYRVEGDTVIFNFTAIGDIIRGMGVDPTSGTITTEVNNGKITSLTYTDDPAWLAKAKVVEDGNKEIVQKFHAAFLAGNIDEAMTYVADDINITSQPYDGEGPGLNGPTEIRGLLEGSQSDHYKLSTADYKAGGTFVWFTYSGIGDSVRALNVGPQIGTAEARVVGGKIRHIVYTDDPAWVEKANAAEAALAANEVGMPRTGDFNPMPVALTVTLGMIMLLAGLSLLSIVRFRTR